MCPLLLPRRCPSGAPPRPALRLSAEPGRPPSIYHSLDVRAANGEQRRLISPGGEGGRARPASLPLVAAASGGGVREEEEADRGVPARDLAHKPRARRRERDRAPALTHDFGGRGRRRRRGAARGDLARPAPTVSAEIVSPTTPPDDPHRAPPPRPQPGRPRERSQVRGESAAWARTPASPPSLPW